MEYEVKAKPEAELKELAALNAFQVYLRALRWQQFQIPSHR